MLSVLPLLRKSGSYQRSVSYPLTSHNGCKGRTDAYYPQVEYVKEDAVITIADGFNTTTGAFPHAIVSQTNALWNLACLSSHTPVSSPYEYESTAGSGTCSYIVDTGITTTLAVSSSCQPIQLQ